MPGLVFVALLSTLIPACVARGPRESRHNGDGKSVATPSPSPSPSPSVENTPSPQPSPQPSPRPSPSWSDGILIATPTPGIPDPSDSVPLVSAPVPPNMPELEIPVAGVKGKDLRDTFSDERSEGRMHGALDIMAPQGTPVVAAADGKIQRLFYSVRGGNTIYQTTFDGSIVFYYAHLDRFADGVADGQRVRKGETIGFVGDTGTAGAGNFHLHFAIWIPIEPKRYWDGANVNPYPLLKDLR